LERPVVRASDMHVALSGWRRARMVAWKEAGEKGRKEQKKNEGSISFFDYREKEGQKKIKEWKGGRERGREGGREGGAYLDIVVRPGGGDKGGDSQVLEGG